MTSKLTVNLGLRYDIDTGFVERYNRQSLFDPYASTPLAKSTGVPVMGSYVFSGVGGQPRSLWKTTGHIAPRVGVAYSLNSKTVIRGAYSIFYLPTSQRGYGVATNNGYNVSTSFVANYDGVTPVGSIANPFPDGAVQITGNTLGALTLIGNGASGYTPDLPMPYVQQWNFGIQRQLPASFLVSVAYAGSHSVKLPTGINPNALRPEFYGTWGDQQQVVYLTQLVPNPFYGYIKSGTMAAATVQRYMLLTNYPQYTSTGLTQDVAGAFYNAAQLSLKKTMSHGLATSLAYTFSKNLGDANNLVTGFLDVGTPSYQDQLNRHNERAVLASDVTHRLVWNGNLELPFGRGKHFGSHLNRWVDAAVGGWQTNGIYTFQSGYPLQFGVTGTQNFAGGRPSFVGDNPTVYTEGDITQRLGGVSGGPGYLVSSAFAVPLSFQKGNVPRLTDRIRAPNRMNVDFSMMKYFNVTERFRIQLRGEAFSLLNHPIFNSPGTTVGSSTFGVISGMANSPRTIQVATKVTW